MKSQTQKPSLLRRWFPPVLGALSLFIMVAVPDAANDAIALGLNALVALVCAVLWLIPVRANPEIDRRRSLKWVLGATIGLALSLSAPACVSIFGHVSGGQGGLYDPSSTLIQCTRLLGVACAFMMGLRLSLNDEAGLRWIQMLLILGASWAVISIMMHLSDPTAIYGVIKNGENRLTGAFSSPNTAACFFGALATLAIGMVLSGLQAQKNPDLKHLNPAATGCFLATIGAITLTVSRSGIIATLSAIIIVLGIMMWRRLPIKWAAGLGGMIIVILLIIFSGPLDALMDRVNALKSDADVRLMIYKVHLDAAQHQAWIGSGLGSFNAINNSLMNPSNYGVLWSVRAAHNVYLQWFEETGIFGLITLGIVNLTIIIPILSAALRDQDLSTKLWPLLGAYIVMLLHGLTDYGFQEPAISALAALLLGTAYGLATGKRTSIRKRKVLKIINPEIKPLETS